MKGTTSDLSNLCRWFCTHVTRVWTWNLPKWKAESLIKPSLLRPVLRRTIPNILLPYHTASHSQTPGILWQVAQHQASMEWCLSQTEQNTFAALSTGKHSLPIVFVQSVQTHSIFSVHHKQWPQPNSGSINRGIPPNQKLFFFAKQRHKVPSNPPVLVLTLPSWANCTYLQYYMQ